MQANERDQIKVGNETVKIECMQALNKDECMQLLDEEKATMTTLDAGEVFIGGRYHSLVPIAQEILEGNIIITVREQMVRNLLFAAGFNNYYAVAVVKAGRLTDIHTLKDLKGKKACFAGVETYAGWILPVSTVSFLIV